MLSTLIEEQRAVILLGSGGVGKTTSAAALALDAASKGKRVLCLTIDPAKRLAQSLGIDRMTSEMVQISASTFEQAGLHCAGELHVMMLDAKRTFDELVSVYAKSEESQERILNNPIYRQISTSLAGTQEYMAMEKLFALHKDPRFDLIVLDTPPAEHAIDFLSAPERMIEALDSPALRWFVEAFRQDRKLSLNLVGKSAAMILSGLAKFTGAGLLDDIASFIITFNELFGGFRKRAQEVGDVLKSDDVVALLVARPDDRAIKDLKHLHDAALQRGVHVEGIVINHVHPLLSESQLETNDDITRFELMSAQSQRHALEKIGDLLERYPTYFAEHRGEDVRDLQELRSLATSLSRSYSNGKSEHDDI